MNSNWDYVIQEDDYTRTLFRVYPKCTYIHSFGDAPPKTWKNVYKVYYSWAFIKQYKDDDGNIEWSERLMYMYCDECSNVVNLSEIIKWVLEEGHDVFDEPTFGQPAGDWRIEAHRGKGYDGKPYESYTFFVFDNWRGNGFRFRFDRKQTEDFADWLEKMNERALVKCGCPI